MGSLLALLVILGTLLQTLVAARMAWRAKLRLGAFGLAALAAASVAVPLFVFWRLR